jgi:glycosyltransferase involved in cell wall biosynthesis
MQYVFVDDSPLQYDGYTNLRRAIGGAEKAVGGLASALAERGHEVKVINRTTYAHMADGAYYTPFGDSWAPKAADVIIAMRKPSLLGHLRQAKHRLLWVTGAPEYLTAEVNTPLWESFNPGLIFLSDLQHSAYKGKLPRMVMNPGVRAPYWEPPLVHESDPHEEALNPELYAARMAVAAAMPQGPPGPYAIVTSHPLHGLSWLLDLWTTRIHTAMPTARLSIFSASLSKAQRGEGIADDLAPVFAQVQAAASANVAIADPISDDGMAAVFRTARVHLYPGHAQDYVCWTLGESQAAGLPAVARALGGTVERIANGQTGYVVPDADAFANVALQILGDDGVYTSLNEEACRPTRRRTWTMAADELDSFVASLKPSA